MNQKRPINLDLTTMKFPVMAIASILHRLSGLAIFLILPLIIYFLGQSLKSSSSYHQLQFSLSTPLSKILLWIFAVSVVFHFLAGLRHIILDLGYGESLRAGRASAVFVIALTVILMFLLGIWIW